MEEFLPHKKLKLTITLQTSFRVYLKKQTNYRTIAILFRDTSRSILHV